MGWFEKQIRQRKDLDQLLLEESFLRAAEAVLGEKTAVKISYVTQAIKAQKTIAFLRIPSPTVLSLSRRATMSPLI